MAGGGYRRLHPCMGLVPDGVRRNLGKLIGRLYFIEGTRQSELGKVRAADDPRQV